MTHEVRGKMRRMDTRKCGNVVAAFACTRLCTCADASDLAFCAVAVVTP